MKEDLRPSAYMVMAVIRDGYDTGYQIKQFLERAASFFWSASYGQIYPELKRLEKAGMLSGRSVTANGRRSREYSLTSEGLRELDRWLSEPDEPTIRMQNEGMLRLMLCDWTDTEVVRRNLDSLKRSNAERLGAVKALKPPRERGRRLQQLGVRLLSETIEWCEETEASLAELGPGEAKP